VDGAGNVYIGDNYRIRRVAAETGIVTTIAGNGTIGFSGDGGPATSAGLSSPRGLTIDDYGNLFIADNTRIRRVTAYTGIITTVAGNGTVGFSGDGGPATSAMFYCIRCGVAVDAGGNVLITDTENHRIRQVNMVAGVITTVVGNGTAGFSGDGGPATSAGLAYPTGVAVDGGGNLFIADASNRRIRRVAADTGIITTVAGNGGCDYTNSGDGGPATSVGLCYLKAVAVDGVGNLLIATGSHIRLVAAPTQPTPLPTPSPSTTPYCFPTLFRPLPRTDLVGSLVGSALAPGEPLLAPTEAGCRQACCDAAACDGFSFDVSISRRLGSADCYLYVNVSQLVPSSGYTSGLRESVLL
jgi:hypothetical protein